METRVEAEESAETEMEREPGEPRRGKRRWMRRTPKPLSLLGTLILLVLFTMYLLGRL